jgi:hypothetical protein
MKKRAVWVASIIVLVFLVVRLGYIRLNDLRNEKAWYLSELHYDCSAKIDSVIRPGRALLRITNGTLNEEREWKLKERLHIHGILHLAILNGPLYDLRVPNEALAGDSVYINSDDNALSVYRDGRLLISRPLSESFRQRPF